VPVSAKKPAPGVPEASDYSRKKTMMEFLSDLWDFLRVRKKIWLLPIILILVVLGALAVVSQQSVLGSFIYTLF
jgi:hypothetical protein